jgi:hypothetical protein
VARRIFDLHRRHASAVCRIFDEAITLHAAALRQGTLPSTCLLSLIVSRREGESTYPERSGELERAVTIGVDILMAVDEVRKRVIFNRWGEIRGVSAGLIITLAEPFRQAMRDELAPEHYPFMKTLNLIRKTNCDANEALRRRVLRCRNDCAAGDECGRTSAFARRRDRE